MGYLLVRGDARYIPLADRSVHCVVTSPPYWGLRDYGVDGQIGLEATPDAFVVEMVRVFREVRRVLRDDGTLWLNLGDTYNAYNGNRGSSPSISGNNESKHPVHDRGLMAANLKPKDLVGIPWRVALALQADGWYLRSDIIWHKPAPMPESVTDRPTKAHEYLFLLTKSDRYFYDAEAVREPFADNRQGADGSKLDRVRNVGGRTDGYTKPNGIDPSQNGGRNLRSVWTVNTEPYPGAHFAVFPRKLVEPCIKAGTSEKGCCPRCGAQWRRLIDSKRVATRPGNSSKVYIDPEGSPYERHRGSIVGNRDPFRHTTVFRTAGWEPGCDCGLEPCPCVVFDPFNGSGTTPQVAVGLGRRGIGCDLNPDYLDLARRRLERPHAPVIRAGRDEPLPLFEAKEANHADA